MIPSFRPDVTARMDAEHETQRLKRQIHDQGERHGHGSGDSRTIVEAHGGRLWAENSQAGGAAFRFTLPTAA